MARELSMATRRELVQRLRERYSKADVKEKRKLLHELIAVTGYHRNHAIGALRESPVSTSAPGQRRRYRLYGAAVKTALIVLWEEHLQRRYGCCLRWRRSNKGNARKSS